MAKYQPRPPPLTAFCMQLSGPENLLRAVNSVMIDASSDMDKRASVLFVVLMSVAGYFVGNLQSNEEQMYKELRPFLRDTNLDVIAAETGNWIMFLMYRFWQADKNKDPEIYERIGKLTFSRANRLVLGTIKSQTGFDFTARALENRNIYSQSMNDPASRSPLVESFSAVLLGSIGCRTLAEPPKAIEPVPLRQFKEWTLLNLVVSLFFSTMPLSYYDTFKNMLRERSDLFPHDED